MNDTQRINLTPEQERVLKSLAIAYEMGGNADFWQVDSVWFRRGKTARIRRTTLDALANKGKRLIVVNQTHDGLLVRMSTLGFDWLAQS